MEDVWELLVEEAEPELDLTSSEQVPEQLFMYLSKST
jgi:hypothetical protein